MQANRLDSCPSTSFLALVICLRWSHNTFGGGDVSKDVLHELGDRIGFLKIVFSR